MIKGKEIENRDDPNTSNDYIPTRKNAPANSLNSFDQRKYHNYNQKEVAGKEARNAVDVSQEEKDRQNKGKLAENFIT